MLFAPCSARHSVHLVSPTAPPPRPDRPRLPAPPPFPRSLSRALHITMFPSYSLISPVFFFLQARTQRYRSHMYGQPTFRNRERTESETISPTHTPPPRSSPLPPVPPCSLPRPVQAKALHPGGGGRDGSSPDRDTVTTIEYDFRCDMQGGNIKVKDFIQKAYEWYTNEMRSTEDHSRYM